MTDSTISHHPTLCSKLTRARKELVELYTDPTTLMTSRSSIKRKDNPARSGLEMGTWRMHQGRFGDAYRVLTQAYVKNCPKASGDPTTITVLIRRSQAFICTYSAGRRAQYALGTTLGSINLIDWYDELSEALSDELRYVDKTGDDAARLCLLDQLIELHLCVGAMSQAHRRARQYLAIVKAQPTIRRYRLLPRARGYEWRANPIRFATANRMARQNPEHHSSVA